jgi:uncharacterized membrane protein
MKKVAPIMLILMGLSYPQPSSGQALRVTQDLPGLGRVQAINKSGEIAAFAGTGDDVQGVLIAQNGSVTSIVVPGSKQTLPYGMNNSTWIVGAYYNPDYRGAHGFLYNKGTYTTIDVPGGTDTMARGINDAMQIVGDYSDSSARHGFLYDGSNFTHIDVPGAVATFIYGLNDPGIMVGQYTDSQRHRHGFVFANNGFTTMDVPFPGATDTFVCGISNPGTIVGTYIDAAGTHGFVNANGVFLSIDAPDTPPKGVGTFARSVNDNNQVLLYGTIAHIAGM